MVKVWTDEELKAVHVATQRALLVRGYSVDESVSCADAIIAKLADDGPIDDVQEKE